MIDQIQMSEAEALQVIADAYQIIDNERSRSEIIEDLKDSEKSSSIVNIVLFGIRSEKLSLEYHRDNPEDAAKNSIIALSPLKPEQERGIVSPRDMLSEIRLGKELNNISGTWAIAIANLSDNYDKVVLAANRLGISHNDDVTFTSDDPEI